MGKDTVPVSPSRPLGWEWQGGLWVGRRRCGRRRGAAGWRRRTRSADLSLARYWEWRHRPGGAAATRPGADLSPPSLASRPPQDLPTRAARSFSDSCSGSPARRAVLCLARLSPPPIVPSHDHPADCPPGLGTLGFPPRGRQGLRATSRHFPGKSVLGRAWERGASVGWRRAACGGESGWLEPCGDRGGAYKMCCALSARCHPPPLARHFAQGQAGSVRAVPRPTTVFFLSPGSVALPARRRSLCPWRLGAPQTQRAGN